jgi:hypothetical protein
MKPGDMVTLTTDDFKGPAIVWSSPRRDAGYLCNFTSQSFGMVLGIDSGIKWNSSCPTDPQIKILLEHGQGWINQKFLKVIT